MVNTDEEMHKNEGGDQNREKEGSSTVIGPKSAIQVGSLALIGAIIWWAAQLTTDVNTIKTSLVRLNGLDTLGGRLENLEKFGSPMVWDMKKEIAQLSETLRMHIATTTPPSRAP